MKRLVPALLTVLLTVGCDNADRQREAIETAEKRVKAGAFREAVGSYESALDGTAKTAELHYQIAVLYDVKLKQPLDAIHHYDRYLDFEPNGTHVKDAKSARADCDKRLQMKLSKEGMMTTAQAAQLRNENEQLRQLNVELRNPKPPPPPKTFEPGKADPLPPGARSHTVVAGDTLASIAFKYYKNRARADHIRDANFNQLKGRNTIFPGQVLIIPEAPAKPRR